MAEVDFSNARIEPCSLSGFENPTRIDYQSLNSATFIDSGNTSIANVTRTKTVDESKQLIYLYNGNFRNSGTEFYIYCRTNVGGNYKLTGWKVSNISFSNGDTFIFQVKASLVCN